MITRSQIKYEIWTHLNKSVATKGFYTDEKVNSAVQQCLDAVAVQMFLADEGWNHKLTSITTVANQVTVPVPSDLAMILEVRYLIGTMYVPMGYDQQWGQSQWALSSGASQYPGSYRLVDNAIYFNPPLTSGGTDFLQIEYAAYPTSLKKDSQAVPSQFDRAMFWWTVFHSCVVLTTGVKMSTDWPQQETFWWQNMVNMIGMRTRQSIPIRDFMG
jgi:hypothetical protein